MADLQPVSYIWKNGEIIPWEDATTHVLTHALHYGSAVFEGIRCYYDEESGDSVVFRLQDHMERLHRSAKMIMMDLPYSVDELCQATVDLIKANDIKSCYIRPLAYYGYGQMGVDPTGAPTDVIIAVWPWDAYLGEEALERGIDVGISSWRQRSFNAIPPAIKSAASYLNSILAKLEVRNGILSTPPLSDGLLEGVTRDSVLTIACDLDIPALEESLTRADLYIADEAFMTGSAAELTPVHSIDDRVVGDRGPITTQLQKRYFDVAYGRVPEYEEWITRIKK